MRKTPIDAQAFSPPAYVKLITSLRARGYEPRGYLDVDPSARHLIIRHDVDFSLTAALSMAKLEAAASITSTYFILLRTEFYNAMSAEGFDALDRIAALGHSIGLHFDAALYARDGNVLDAAIARECGLLEYIVGKSVKVMSFHRPAPELVGEADEWAGRLNAYGPRFVRDMGYCSDSRGAWHNGAPLDHPAVQQGRALQLLVHPFWWQLPALSPEERLQRFLAERSGFLDKELVRHCTVHRVSGTR